MHTTLLCIWDKFQLVEYATASALLFPRYPIRNIPTLRPDYNLSVFPLENIPIKRTFLDEQITVGNATYSSHNRVRDGTGGEETWCVTE